MKTSKPEFIEAALISTVILTTYFIMPERVVFYSMITSTILVGFGTSLKKMAKPAIKLFLLWSGFIILVSFGRYLGGIKTSVLVTQGVSSLSLFLALSSSLAILASVKPVSVLLTFDIIGLPRTISYIYLSVGTLVETVKSMGERQLRSLKLKGLVPASLAGRIRSYWRLLGPLFSILLSRQLVHARSLEYRGFFTTRYARESGEIRIASAYIKLTALLIINIILWIGVKICVL